MVGLLVVGTATAVAVFVATATPSNRFTVAVTVPCDVVVMVPRARAVWVFAATAVCVCGRAVRLGELRTVGVVVPSCWRETVTVRVNTGLMMRVPVRSAFGDCVSITVRVRTRGTGDTTIVDDALACSSTLGVCVLLPVLGACGVLGVSELTTGV
jgi:hypothetical protein